MLPNETRPVQFPSFTMGLPQTVAFSSLVYVHGGVLVLNADNPYPATAANTSTRVGISLTTGCIASYPTVTACEWLAAAFCCFVRPCLAAVNHPPMP